MEPLKELFITEATILPVGTSRGGAAPGAGAHPPPGEGEERAGDSDQRDERQAGGGRADGSEGGQEDHPEAGGEGKADKDISLTALSAHSDMYSPDGSWLFYLTLMNPVTFLFNAANQQKRIRFYWLLAVVIMSNIFLTTSANHDYF